MGRSAPVPSDPTNGPAVRSRTSVSAAVLPVALICAMFASVAAPQACAGSGADGEGHRAVRVLRERDRAVRRLRT